MLRYIFCNSNLFSASGPGAESNELYKIKNIGKDPERTYTEVKNENSTQSKRNELLKTIRSK
jgi:hypothetical protein